MPLLVLILLCAALGGIASAALAVVFLWLPQALAARLLPHCVSFATGALLGAALLGLLPEALTQAGAAGAHAIGLTLLAGLGVFFVIEKVILWWHAEEDAGFPDHTAHGAHRHAHETPRDRASGLLVLVGDSVHNALDGVLIAAAFLTDRPLGLATTLAVAAHEIPHRVGDFAVLVHAGFTRARALALNLATGLAAVFGAVAAWYGLRRVVGLLPYALAFAAAGFLYIAVAGLIPGLHRRADSRTSAMQVILIALGVGAIELAERLAGQ